VPEIAETTATPGVPEIAETTATPGVPGSAGTPAKAPHAKAGAQHKQGGAKAETPSIAETPENARNRDANKNIGISIFDSNCTDVGNTRNASNRRDAGQEHLQ
jgi:hypothetical protein